MEVCEDGTDRPSNEYMKVQLAKLKADQEKTGKKVEHKVCLRASCGHSRHPHRQVTELVLILV